MKFIDTHTHLYTEEFAADRSEVVERATEAGAVALLLPNIDEASIGPMLDMAMSYPHLCYPMMGLHPTELPQNPEPLLKRMEQLVAAPDAPYVAIGEVGIDLYWDSSRREEQISVFRTQAEWSIRYGLPLVVHSRSAHADIVQTLQPLAAQLNGGVFHCFGGTADEARELLQFPGFCLGIGGTVTFKKSKLPQVLREAVPLGRIVVETDAPYLAPTPHRGTRNETAYIPLIVDALAEIYGVTTDEVCDATTQNARTIFKKLK